MNPDENLNPNGELTETPIGSQPESITSDDSGTVNSQGAGNSSSEEEANWSNLNGSSQERFKQMARTAKQLREENETLKARPAYQVPMPPVYNPPTATPDVTDAVRKLSEYGIADKTYVDNKIQEGINQSVGGLAYQYELDKLENRYNGNDGLPAFSRDEYENYIAAHPQYRGYQPEDVYEKMFRQEIVEHQARNLGKPTAKPANSLRPTRTQVREEQWTPEAIEAKLQSLSEHDRVTWIDKNKGLIDTVLQRTAPSE